MPSDRPDSLSDAVLVHLPVVLFTGVHLDMLDDLICIIGSYQERALGGAAVEFIGHWTSSIGSWYLQIQISDSVGGRHLLASRDHEFGRSEPCRPPMIGRSPTFLSGA